MSEPTMPEGYSLTLVEVIEATPASYSLETAARLAGIHPEMLRHYCRLGLLGEARERLEPEPFFDDDTLFELRRFEHYREHFGVNRKTLRLLVSLWRENERLRAELRFLRGP